MRRVLIIPAAGRGSRLNVPTPKALTPVNGRAMLDHLADLYGPLVDRVVVVAHPSFAGEIAAWGRAHGRVSIAQQAEPTGMLDGVLAGATAAVNDDPSEIWVTWADQVGVLPETVARLATAIGSGDAALALPTVRRIGPYIHFDRDPAGRIVRLLERREGDQMPAEGESDIGLFAMTRDTFDMNLREYARVVVPGRGTGERNFVPFVPWLAQRRPVVTFPCADPREAVGINTPEQLDEVSAWLRSRS